MPTWVKQPGKSGNAFARACLTPNREQPSWTVQKRDSKARFHGRWNRGLPTVSSKQHRKNNLAVVVLMPLCGVVSMAFLRCRSVRFEEIENLTVRFGAVFGIRERYGAVRCGFQMPWTLRCGSVISYVLRYGSVWFPNRKVHGAMLFGVEEGRNPTVGLGAFNRTEPHQTDKKNRTVNTPAFGSCLFPLFSTSYSVFSFFLSLSFALALFQFSYVARVWNVRVNTMASHCIVYVLYSILLCPHVSVLVLWPQNLYFQS